MKTKQNLLSTELSGNLMSANVAQKISLVILIMVGLISCSSNELPTPQKLAADVQMVEPNTVISVIAQDDYPVPEGSQIIEKTGAYRTLENVYSRTGNEVLIPKNAIISGTYKNDGVACAVTWNAVYANMHEYKKLRGSFSLGKVTGPSICNPTAGIKEGGRLTINFY